jgi:hypothetical protein
MSIMGEIDNFNSEDQAEICWLHRKAAAYQFIVDTLEQYGIIDVKKENGYDT